MSGLVNAVVIVAVIALVIVRQFRAGRIDTDRRWWLLPGVLAVVALREPHLLDAHHPAAAALVLGAEVIVGLAMGAAWAWTTRIWVEPDGAVWSRSTKASVAVWAVGIGLRLGLFGVGTLLGVHQDSSALLLALAATLLVRSGLLIWRTRSLHPTPASATAYGDGVPRSAWKERV
ncbi:DUF1453 family protein [Streptomyces sp. IBSBF 2953]|uniref:DUF1453 domain-containing protein n=1 Tax=Streptomyces TaxID=1883 RepID=UPI00211A5052|nr:DUF1453 domain-containing protein [Streptomyces scabiei]MCQ9181230.1 DUF1453 family protein [Streptomyces hayashii]MDX3113154.1 DUF1453 domain-containing protein [Streptomyces scabiei]